MIRIALIGCGNATDDYGQVAHRLRGARLTAVVDANDTLARRTAEALDSPIWATSIEDLLRDNDDAFDAAVIRRSNGWGQSAAAQAAAAGKHVLLDMRLLLFAPANDTSIAACRSAGVTLMLAQATRFLPSVVEVDDCLRSGVLGMPGLLRIHDWRAADVDGHTSSDAEPAGSTSAAFQTVLPDVDLANWVFGTLPTEVYAAGHVVPEVACNPDGYVQLHLGYPDGGMALVDCSTKLPPGSDYFSLSVFGSAGAAYADDHHNMHLLYRGGRPTALPADRGKLHYLAELQEFVEAIEGSRPPAILVEDGRMATEVIRAAARSLESGRALKLAGSRYEFV